MKSQEKNLKYRRTDLEPRNVDQRALTVDDVIYIRQCDRKNVELSRMYGVSTRSISMIRARKTYQSIPATLFTPVRPLVVLRFVPDLNREVPFSLNLDNPYSLPHSISS